MAESPPHPTTYGYEMRESSHTSKSPTQQGLFRVWLEVRGLSCVVNCVV